MLLLHEAEAFLNVKVNVFQNYCADLKLLLKYSSYTLQAQ